MNNSLGLLLSDKPIRITPELKFYQPTIRDIVNMGEEMYGLLVRIWTLKRKDLIQEETDYTKDKNDLEIWLEYLSAVPKMEEGLINSCLVFFHKKIEFFPLAHTMYIGEGDKGILLDLDLYNRLRNLFSQLDSTEEEEDSQYKETDHMSERERQIYEKLKAGQEKLNRIKNGEVDQHNILGKQIVSLVAIGHYTFSQVYDMTMIQFKNLLKKYVEIDNYELRTMLSPYMSSKDSKQEDKHWLN